MRASYGCLGVTVSDCEGNAKGRRGAADEAIDPIDRKRRIKHPRPSHSITPNTQRRRHTEEWIGGGQTIVLPSDPKQPARRVVWRARGSCTWLAEFVAGRDVPRNGMQLPHGLLSRDALAVEVVDGSSTRAGARDEAALLWTLSPNLVLRCVAFKRPPPLQQQPSQHRHPRANTGEPTTGGATAPSSLASLFDQLPRNEQAEAVALRPPAGSDYPSCCAFVLAPEGRHLVVGYPTGKVRT